MKVIRNTRAPKHGRTHRIGGDDEIPGLAEALTVDDAGSVSVSPTTELIIGTGLKLVEDSDGVAHVTLSDFATYTPQLLGDTTDPTLGAGAVANAVWVKRNRLVYVSGGIDIGTSGFDPGAGIWGVSLPVESDGVSQIIGQACLSNSPSGPTAPNPGVFPFQADASRVIGNPAIPKVTFRYSDAAPHGLMKWFAGDATDWSFNYNDRLDFNLVYYSTA